MSEGDSDAHASRVAEQLRMAEEEREAKDDQEQLATLYVGDHVEDRDEPGATMVVAERPPREASEYRLEGTAKTVADVNPDYPADDDVVEIVYPKRTTAVIENLQHYAFPRSRLERVAAVHDAETDQEDIDD